MKLHATVYCNPQSSISQTVPVNGAVIMSAIIPGECHILDSTTQDGNVVAALLLRDNSYYIHRISQNGIASFQ